MLTIPANHTVTVRAFRICRKSVLRLFRARRSIERYTLAEIVRRTGLDQAVVREVMNDLVAGGTYTKDADGTYSNLIA